MRFEGEIILEPAKMLKDLHYSFKTGRHVKDKYLRNQRTFAREKSKQLIFQSESTRSSFVTKQFCKLFHKCAVTKTGRPCSVVPT